MPNIVSSVIFLEYLGCKSVIIRRTLAVVEIAARTKSGKSSFINGFLFLSDSPYMYLEL